MGACVDAATAGTPATATVTTTATLRECERGRGRKGGERGERRFDYARNFEGLLNPLFFNIGLHTAHHENPHAHWSELQQLHARHYRDRVHPALNEGGLVPYMLRVYVLGAVLPRFRTRPMMPPGTLPNP